MPKKVLIAGVDGMIGSALAHHLQKSGHAVAGTSRRNHGKSIARLDLLNLRGLSELPRVDTAILCAGITGYAVCRGNESATARINVDAQVAMAEHFKQQGTRIVFLSSNAVFDGKVHNRLAHDKMRPLTAYGRQKAEAERLLLSLSPTTVVLRLSKVLAPTMQLLAGWVQSLGKRNEIEAYDDLYAAPIPISLVCKLLGQIVGSDQSAGVYQMSATYDVSYVEIGRHIASRVGAPPSLVVPSPSAKIPPQEKPRFTSLDASRTVSEFGIEPPTPLAAVDEVFFPHRVAATGGG